MRHDPHRADRFILRAIETHPHAHPVPWPGQPDTSITHPAGLGLFEDGQPAHVTLLRRNALIGGTTESGKSGVLNVILAFLAACTDVIIWGIDLKGGMELQPWTACLQRLATTPSGTRQSRRAVFSLARGLVAGVADAGFVHCGAFRP
jgi:DNA segregation ATPase FtsK/SpoIIIE, S-DNA-T family